MYEACQKEYEILLRDERGEHQISVDDEDIAHLENAGADFTVVRELPKREEIDLSRFLEARGISQ